MVQGQKVLLISDVEIGGRMTEQGSIFSEFVEAREAMVRHLDDFTRVARDWTDTLRKSNEHLRRFERLSSIETLASGIAHEINNPLNSILLIAKYAIKGKGALDRDEAFQSIIAEAERGGRVVRSILKFAREEQSAKSFGDINEAVQHAVSAARTYLRPAHVRIDMELGESLPSILMNSKDIEEVIVSLVRNAVETAGGKIHVIVKTEAAGDKVRVIVTDDGGGIPREIIAQIFDPFFTTKRTSGGSGLGLSISYGIVSDHGGKLSVRSEPGHGATFTIELPAAMHTPREHGVNTNGPDTGGGRRSQLRSVSEAVPDG